MDLQFEVCVHKWWMCPSTVRGQLSQRLQIRLQRKGRSGGADHVKSPLYPNPDADKEKHEFWYSIYPHKGDWREAGTVKQAYLFNNPLMAAVKNGSDRTLPPQYSLVSVDADNIVIEVVKQAEDSRDVIRANV